MAINKEETEGLYWTTNALRINSLCDLASYPTIGDALIACIDNLDKLKKKLKNYIENK